MTEPLHVPLPDRTLAGAGESTAPADPALPTRRRVLVIDDSVLVREAARVALSATSGCEVITAESGEEGFDLALSAHPDAILLDVVMPGVDGLEVLARLRGNLSTSAVPVVLLTASSELDTRETAEELGVSGIIAKPFDVDALAGDVAALLGWPA
jgi:two-component system, OmpR family, alkaline phosphatase synthesis response regulator PhoP